jgi:acetate kinase
VKYQLYENDSSILRGSIENIGSDRSVHKTNGNSKSAIQKRFDYPEAIRAAIGTALTVRSQVSCVGHRVVHGGPDLTSPTLISPDTLEAIKSCSALAPLHNPSNVRGIELSQLALPGVPQVACFDTAFHANIPHKAYTYAIPKDLASANKLRRYGFHGLSYSFISSVVKEDRIIVAHLGSGCSAAAIVNGRSVDTTMGFTPMEGLVMSSRSGTVDPGLVLYLLNQPGSTVDSVSNILNKRSGLLGLSGITADMKELLRLEKENNAAAHEAVEVFVYTVQKFIGQLLAALEYNVEAIVFTGGIGENSPEIRERIVQGMSRIGVSLNSERNVKTSANGLISTDNSRVRVYAIPTDEERQIARDTIRTVFK